MRSDPPSGTDRTEFKLRCDQRKLGQFRRRGLERSLDQVFIVQSHDGWITRCAESATCRLAGHPLFDKIHDSGRRIAATALAAGIELISDDKVFRKAPGLSVLSTTKS